MKNIDRKENRDFDFASLRKDYANKGQREQFRLGRKEDPVSCARRNPSYRTSEKRKQVFPYLEEDKNDPLLFRFDKKKHALGKSMEQAIGAFYILDPSSAYPSYFLGKLLPPSFVSMDLCAAPGGKSIALSFRRKDGLFLANDISYTRAIEIQKNADKLGRDNLLSLSRDPRKRNLSSCFDLVILDAPCSGSGRIRKEKKRRDDFSLEKVSRLLPIQESLLEKAVSLVKKGGYLCYSTCSLSIEEDEEQVRKRMKRHKEMELVELPVDRNVLIGKNKIGYHMVPGIYQGEGIYFAVLRKNNGERNSLTPLSLQNHVFPFRKREYYVQRMFKEISSLGYISPGLKIKDSSPYPKCEFDYAYSKAVTTLPFLPLSRKEARDYLLGNQLSIHSERKDGLVVLSYQGIPLGFGKKIKNQVKNYLPKGLRVKTE